MPDTPATRVHGRSRDRIGDGSVAARRPRRGGLAAALAIRRAGVTLGLAGCVLGGAAALPGGQGPAAATAGQPGGWSIVPSPNGSRMGSTLVGVSASSATSAWAVGYRGLLGERRTLTERWNGSAWRVVPSPQAGHPDSGLWGVTALSPDNVWAVGNQNIGNFRFRPLVEHWNGTAWTQVRVPSPPLRGVGASLFGVAATSPRNIWAVGSYDTGTSSHRFQPLIVHWNGKHWSLIPAPVPGSAQLNQISLQAPGNGWAVGSLGAVPRTQALILHWNGHHWTKVGSPAIRGSSLAGVLALTPHEAWAVGSYSLPHGRFRTLIERWDGRAWTVTPSPNRHPSSELLGITGTPRRIWSVGDSFTPAGPPFTSTLILRH